MIVSDSDNEPPQRTSVERLAAIATVAVRVGVSHARLMIAAAVGLALLSAGYVATHFEMRTDLDALLSSDLPWRAEASRTERAFPGEGDDIVIVIDGDTPELTQHAAQAMSETLIKYPKLFASVRRSNGGAFFDRYGVLFLDRDEVAKTTADLIAGQPLLGPLAADPSLRGLMKSVETAVSGATDDPARLALVDRALVRIASVVEETEAGRPSSLSWRSLLNGRPDRSEDRRQFIQIQPKLDYADAMPAQAHTALIRKTARRLALTPANGVTVRITGSAPIADDELKTLQETAGPIGIIMLLAMIGILYLAVRSTGVVVSILATVAVGAIATSAIGLLIFHRFNLISIAFFPLFVGLGVDFAIQFCVRASAETTAKEPIREVLVRTATAIGGAIVLAVAATIAAFSAFLPTSYRGVSELGLIAGAGMFVALILTFTLLPALLTFLHGRRPIAEKGFKALQHADAAVLAHARAIVGGAVVLAVAALTALPMLGFNFDPMALRDPRSESMATYRSLENDVDTTPNTLNVLEPDLASALKRARSLEVLPTIAHAFTLNSFVPTDQTAKLAMIEDARTLLDFTVNPFDVAPPPSDADLVLTLRSSVVALRGLAPTSTNQALSKSSLRLANALESLAKASPQRRSVAQSALLGGFPIALHQIRTLLTAEPVTLASLPSDIRNDWVSPSGLARIEVVPKSPLRSPAEIAAFVGAVRKIAPLVSGDAVTIVESGRTILTAFAVAGLLSTLGILILLVATLRSLFWAAMAILPVLLSGDLTFATLAVTRQAINLENMIALPLLLGIGVAFNIYFVMARRSGVTDILASSLAKAVVFSALTTGTAFAALALSAHPGTASMGILLIVALAWILVTTLAFLPALLQLAVPTRRGR